MREPSLAAKLGAEALGTFVLVFGGCGAAILAAKFLSDDNVQLGIGFVGVSLAFGLSVLAGAFAFGHVSGGHFNPAVTIGLAIAKRFAWKGVLPYVVTQIVSIDRWCRVVHNCQRQAGLRCRGRRLCDEWLR